MSFIGGDTIKSRQWFNQLLTFFSSLISMFNTLRRYIVMLRKPSSPNPFGNRDPLVNWGLLSESIVHLVLVWFPPYGQRTVRGGATRGRSCLVMELNSPLKKGQKRLVLNKLFWLTDDQWAWETIRNDYTKAADICSVRCLGSASTELTPILDPNFSNHWDISSLVLLLGHNSEF